MFQITLETQIKLYISNNFLVTITTIVLMSDNTGKLFGSNFLSPSWSWSFSAPIFVSELELELELLGSTFFLSELELEPQSSGGQIGAGSKLEPIVHL